MGLSKNNGSFMGRATYTQIKSEKNKMALPKHKTMIEIERSTIQKLQLLKLCKRESYDEIINRILEKGVINHGENL